MFDVVLDTNVLADVIAAYYQQNIRFGGNFVEYETITDMLVTKLNEVLNNFRDYGTFEKGVIIGSSFAFIELARQFTRISRGRFSIVQFRAFIESPPEWFIIYPLNGELFQYLNDLPNSVTMKDGSSLSLEWADTIHVATALSRDENCMIATTDGRLESIEEIAARLILKRIKS